MKYRVAIAEMILLYTSLLEWCAIRIGGDDMAASYVREIRARAKFFEGYDVD